MAPRHETGEPMAGSSLHDHDDRVHFTCRCGRSVGTVADSDADRARRCSRCRRRTRANSSLTR